jgi:hypothetical protein
MTAFPLFVFFVLYVSFWIAYAVVGEVSIMRLVSYMLFTERHADMSIELRRGPKHHASYAERKSPVASVDYVPFAMV